MFTKMLKWPIAPVSIATTLYLYNRFRTRPTTSVTSINLRLLETQTEAQSEMSSSRPNDGTHLYYATKAYQESGSEALPGWKLINESSVDNSYFGSAYAIGTLRLTTLLTFFILITQSIGCTKNVNKVNSSTSISNTQVGYISTSDVKLYYKIIGAGEPVIILHGGPGLNHGYLLPEMTKLAKTHQIILYDQRGCGQSTPTTLDNKNININKFVEDLENVRKSLGYNKFVLMGHSWGGMLAMQYAIHHSDNLSALILLDSIPATSKGLQAANDEYQERVKPISDQIASIEKSERFIKRDPKAVADFYRKIFEPTFYNKNDIQKLSLKFTSADAWSSLKVREIFQETFFNSNFDLRSNLRILNIPTLIVHADHDYIPMWTAEEIAQAIPNAQLSIIEQSSHFPYIEQSKEFFLIIQNFLKEKCIEHKDGIQ